MIRKSSVAAGALLLAACNNNGGGANNAAAAPAAPEPPAKIVAHPAVPPPPANATEPAPDLEGARVLIGQIYMPYTRGEIPRLGAIYTPELQRSITRQSDADTGLGFDPFCRCQDFDHFRYTIQAVEPRPGGATARIAFTNFGERHVVTLLLDYRRDRWLVADIREGRDSLLAGR